MGERNLRLGKEKRGRVGGVGLEVSIKRIQMHHDFISQKFKLIFFKNKFKLIL